MLSESQLRSGLPSSPPRKRGSCRNSAASRNLSSARACGSAVAAASVRRSRERHRAGTRSRKTISSPDGKRKNLSDLPGASRLPAPSFRRNGFSADLKSKRFTVRRRNWRTGAQGEERFSAAPNGRTPRSGFAASLSESSLCATSQCRSCLERLVRVRFLALRSRRLDEVEVHRDLVPGLGAQRNHGYCLSFGNRPLLRRALAGAAPGSRLPLRESSALRTAKETLRRRCRQRRQATFALDERPPRRPPFLAATGAFARS